MPCSWAPWSPGTVLLPQLFWFRSLRTNRWVIAVVALGVLAGMWMERFWIVVNSLKASLLAANIGDYSPSLTDLAMMAGERGAVHGAVHGAGARDSVFFPVRRAGTAIPEQGGRGMKKRVTSGWVLSFSSEEALLQAVRTLVKEEGVFWEVWCALSLRRRPVCQPSCREGRRRRRAAVGRGWRSVRIPGRGPVALLDAVLCGSSHDPGRVQGLGQLARRTFPPCLKGPCSGPDF